MATPDNITQVRLTVGDTNNDLVWLEDNTYQWLLESNGNRVIDAAIEALEMIINQVALAPQSVQTEDVREVGPAVDALERRLTNLKAKRSSNTAVTRGFPMIIKSDRKNWDDIDSIYRNCTYGDF